MGFYDFMTSFIKRQVAVTLKVTILLKKYIERKYQNIVLP